MAYLCVNEDGQEVVLDLEPVRKEVYGKGYWSEDKVSDHGEEVGVDLPKGTIKKLIGRELTWKDEPYEFTEKDNWIDNSVKEPVKKKKVNWRIMLLSIIWSLLLIGLSNFATDLKGSGKLIAIILVTVVTSFVFYFGYRDVDISEKEI